MTTFIVCGYNYILAQCLLLLPEGIISDRYLSIVSMI